MSIAVEKTVWDKLSNIEVKGHISQIIDPKKRRPPVDYIPWANAWSLLKTAYPNATRIVYESDDKHNFHTDGKTAWVKVGVRVENLEHIDYLPIMDFKNDSKPLEAITSMDVNKAIQRSTVKAIAMHGLGLELWSKEEAPLDPPKATSKGAATETKPVLSTKDPNWKKVSGYVTENFAKGADALIKTLETRYKISAATKKVITKLVADATPKEAPEEEAPKEEKEV